MDRRGSAMFMRKVIVFMAVLLAGGRVFAAGPAWALKGILGASYNATDVSDSWTGPEKDSLSWGAKLEASAERNVTYTNWITTLKEEYGRTKNAGSDEQTSADTVYFTSVYTLKLSHYVNPYVGFILDTQNWRFTDPATYTESLGNGLWLIKKPGQELRTRAGFAAKQFFDSAKERPLPAGGAAISSLADDPATAVIEERRDNTGIEWVTNYDLAVNENVKFTSEANVFSGLKGGCDLRWDNSLYVKISKLVTMQVSYLAIYNYDRLPHPAWPQDVEKRLTVMFGLSYGLF